MPHQIRRGNNRGHIKYLPSPIYEEDHQTAAGRKKTKCISPETGLWIPLQDSDQSIGGIKVKSIYPLSLSQIIINLSFFLNPLLPSTCLFLSGVRWSVGWMSIIISSNNLSSSLIFAHLMYHLICNNIFIFAHFYFHTCATFFPSQNKAAKATGGSWRSHKNNKTCWRLS